MAGSPTYKDKEPATHELAEQVRKLNCLYSISALTEKDIPLEDLLQGIVNLIPSASEFPGETGARILFENREYKTDNHRKIKNKLSLDFVVNGSQQGTLEVCCLKRKPPSADGPFRREDQDWLNNIVTRLAKIIEHKRMVESERRYRTLFGISPLGIGLVTLEGEFLECNDTLLQLVGYSASVINQIKLSDIFRHLEDHAGFLGNLETHGALRDFEVELKRNNGAPYYASVTATRFTLSGEQIILALFQDISMRKMAEQQARTLTQELIKAQEIERLRISCDLHDNVAQDLSSISIACATLFDKGQKVPAEIRAKLSQFSTILQKTIKEVRGLAYDLRPPYLYEMGLVKTVFQYCEDFSERTGVKVDYYSAGMDNLKLGFDAEINLYRLIQEALNNVKKHSGASRLIIRLLASFPDIVLRIEDNGKGFDVNDRLAAAVNEKRMGLRSMEERVSLLRGRMTIQSRSGKGTKILIKIPYRQENSDQQTNCLNCR